MRVQGWEIRCHRNNASRAAIMVKAFLANPASFVNKQTTQLFHR
jgi:hypothetical protein